MQLAEALEAFARLARLSDPDEARALVEEVSDGSPGLSALAEMFHGLPADRLELYQSLLRGSNWGALEKTFVYTCARVGRPWNALCRAYLEAVPPTGWDLNDLAIAFPEYLRDVWQPAHPESPAWLWELAEYERIDLEVFLVAEREVEAGTLLLPAVNPTLQMQQFQHDIADWIRRHEDGGGETLEGEPAANVVITAFYRDPARNRTRFLNVNPLTALALQGWQDGTPSEELALAFAPQLGISDADCLAQLETLARTLEAAGAVSIAG